MIANVNIKTTITQVHNTLCKGNSTKKNLLKQIH